MSADLASRLREVRVRAKQTNYGPGKINKFLDYSQQKVLVNYAPQTVPRKPASVWRGTRSSISPRRPGSPSPQRRPGETSPQRRAGYSGSAGYGDVSGYGRPVFEDWMMNDRATVNRSAVVGEKVAERRFQEDVKMAEEMHRIEMEMIPSPRDLLAREPPPGNEVPLPIEVRKAARLADILPIGSRPARTEATSSAVRHLPTSMPGYTGYIEAKVSDNVYGYRHAHLTTVCRDHRVGPGKHFDGIAGYIRPPRKFQEPVTPVKDWYGLAPLHSP